MKNLLLYSKLIICKKNRSTQWKLTLFFVKLTDFQIFLFYLQTFVGKEEIMNSQDLVKLSADNEEHKQHKKRTKKIKAQLKDQVIYLYLVDYKTMNLNFWSQAVQENGYFPTLFKQ